MATFQEKSRRAQELRHLIAVATSVKEDFLAAFLQSDTTPTPERIMTVELTGTERISIETIEAFIDRMDAQLVEHFQKELREIEES